MSATPRFVAQLFESVLQRLIHKTTLVLRDDAICHATRVALI
ncbi:hypothetical protein GRAN_5193 [Granulicella sibirica]|uniref:Uncharacterized protein n=1 Tax=Granulicella sibirica TaxID=2479048 RepID=A0A4Q0SSG4_9BACT|nr:hypothetical protein GRAN_5193 [Granulicella sibirica]